MEITFDQYKSAVTEYLTVYCVEKGLVENTTIKRKEDILNRLTLFLNGNPFNIENVKAFQHYLYANGWNEHSSRATLVNWLRAFVTWCYKYADLFEKDWSFKIIKPTVHRKKWHLLSEEKALEIIIAGCEPNSFDNSYIRESKREHFLALELILLHGFRIGEVESMSGSDLRLYAETPYLRLRRPKSQEEEWMPIHSHFIPILRERINNERLFRITKKTANKLLKRGAKRLGLEGYDISCHRLRDIYSLSRLRKHPGQLVSRSLRHDSFKTTDDAYSHYDLADIQPVIEDSGVLQSPITPQEFLEKAKKALKIAGLIRPDQYELKIFESNGVVKIEVIFSEKDLFPTIEKV